MKSLFLVRAVPLYVTAVCCLQGCKKSEQTGAGADARPAGAQTVGEVVDLKLKWPVGNKYTYRLDFTQITTIQVPVMPLLQEITMAQTYSTAVIGERPNNGRELEWQ